MFHSQFDRFARAIADLPAQFDLAPQFPASLYLTSDSKHKIFYAPFDYVNTSARIVLVGITPGRKQAIEALVSAQQVLKKGLSQGDATRIAKTAASFAGTMRKNLVDMLDHIGVASRLNIASTASLWNAHDQLVHFTSALRYPVFEEEENFGGSGLLRSRLLVEQLETYFAAETRALPRALFVPLGSAAQHACEHLIRRSDLREDQVLTGLAHPSGANAERIAYWLGRKHKDQLSAKTRADLLDTGRERALRKVAGWS